MLKPSRHQLSLKSSTTQLQTASEDIDQCMKLNDLVLFAPFRFSFRSGLRRSCSFVTGTSHFNRALNCCSACIKQLLFGSMSYPPAQNAGSLTCTSRSGLWSSLGALHSVWGCEGPAEGAFSLLVRRSRPADEERSSCGPYPPWGRLGYSPHILARIGFSSMRGTLSRKATTMCVGRCSVQSSKS